MDLFEEVRRRARAAGGGWLPVEDVQDFAGAHASDIEEFMLDLIPTAASFSRPAISSFKVGAVGLGGSGAIYFGANIEFAGEALNQTIHAEQATVVNAANHGETELLKLAVSAPPCGYCRQFLYELPRADNLDIILRGGTTKKLSEYLPCAFGPHDLGFLGRMLEPTVHNFTWESTELANEAVVMLRAVKSSYAPYTNAYGAAGLITADGTICVGPYLENAAFNPSLPPLQAAIVGLEMAGRSLKEVTDAVVAQPRSSRVDHAAASEALLRRIAPTVRLIRSLIEF